MVVITVTYNIFIKSLVEILEYFECRVTFHQKSDVVIEFALFFALIQNASHFYYTQVHVEFDLAL